MFRFLVFVCEPLSCQKNKGEKMLNVILAQEKFQSCIEGSTVISARLRSVDMNIAYYIQRLRFEPTDIPRAGVRNPDIPHLKYVSFNHQIIWKKKKEGSMTGPCNYKCVWILKSKVLVFFFFFLCSNQNWCKKRLFFFNFIIRIGVKSNQRRLNQG